MSVDDIVIPRGILSTWQGCQPRNNDDEGGESEVFNITEVARRRARSLSIAVARQNDSRGDTLERLADILQTNTQINLPQRPEEISRRGPPTQRPQRSATINLGGLARSRVTGLSTPANPGLSLNRAVSMSFAAGQKRTQKQSVSGTTSDLENSYVFQSIQQHRLSGQAPPSTSSVPSVFLARNGSTHAPSVRKESSRRHLDRSHSDTSQFSAINVVRRASIAVENAVEKVKETITGTLRRSSLQEIYEKAKVRQVQLKRSTTVQIGFQYTFYLLMLATVYFGFVGYPLWHGLVLTIYYLFDMKLVVPAGTAIFLGIGFLYAYLPLLIQFEKEPPQRPPPNDITQVENGQAKDTALLIPCYKSENLIGATLEAALKVFPAQNIFVIANGNSPTPLDNTAAVCERYSVSHTWSPIGSKIVAQFVGCYVSKQFPYVLLIDDDCLLPPNFPIVTSRMRGQTLCIGYTIKSVGPNSSKGTLCQQAQDVEYKISGIQRAFAGKIGSATFPHGAISIWDRQLLIKTFQAHPGFSVSEDWFFGHVARQLGCRIQMCTAVFVETETPTAIFFSGGGARGGFGEMTIYKQRFLRWNYFFVSGLFWDMSYIIRSWRLGWWEIGAKLFVFQEVYETLLYLLAPFVLPISFYVRPSFSGYLYLATLALYQLNVIVFNYVHLSSRHESVSALCLIYYLYYKAVLTFVNIASCYYSIYKYAKYFAKRHPKVIEDEKAVAVVLRLEEESYSDPGKSAGLERLPSVDHARRFTVTAIGTNLSSVAQDSTQAGDAQDIEVVDFANQLAPVLENTTAVVPPRAPKVGRMPPPIPPSGRPFSWHRMTSRTSSNSNVSPFDEGKKLQCPSSPTKSPKDEESPSIADLTPSGRASPSLLRRSISTNLLRRSSSDRSGPQVRRPSGAPHRSPSRRRSLRAFPFSQRMLRQHSSRSSTLTYHIDTPPIEYPPPAAFRTANTAEDYGRDWPLCRANHDAGDYVTVLADTGYRSRDRLFIHEEDDEEDDEGEEEEEEEEWRNGDVSLRDREADVGRKSTQTDRSSRKSRVFISEDGNV